MDAIKGNTGGLKKAGPQEGIPWREAASVLILAADNASPTQSTTQDSYSVVYLRRSKKNKFMPGSYVFPGGALSPCDHSDQWSSWLEDVTGRTVRDIAQDLHIPGQRPHMMTRSRTWGLPPEVVFRICAIRETFEECGVLLVRTRASLTNSREESLGGGGVGRSFSRAYDVMTPAHARAWQERVHGEPASFLALCRECDAVPDLWALAEWSNWLTPILPGGSRRQHRFDTMFYVTCMNSRPRAVQDDAETIDLKWLSCEEALRRHLSRAPENKHFQLEVPQTLESGRLRQLPSITQAALYTATRERHGIERFLPVIVICANGVMIVYPGDEMYPACPDDLGLRDPLNSDKTLEELRDQGQRMFRFLRPFSKDASPELVCTIQPNCGHLPPHITMDTPTKSHL